MAELPDLRGQSRIASPLLLCRACGGEYSATRGDYFLLPRDHVLTCANGHRAWRLELVTRHTVYRPVGPPTR